MLAIVVAAAPACGVRQFNSKDSKVSKQTEVPVDQKTQIFGPFSASGQGGESMTTRHCGSNNGRPCISARASVGKPYQYDINSNAVQGVASGTGFGAAGTPYTTQAGAGKTKVASGPRTPENPRLENPDLHILGRQPAPGEHRIQ